MPEQKFAPDISEVIRSSDDAVALSNARLCGPRVPEFLDRSFPEIFAAQVSRHLDKIAIICGKQQLTYDELNARSNQIARRLRELGIARESIVGICIDRSIDMAIGIVSILKAGAGYLPLDPDYSR